MQQARTFVLFAVLTAALSLSACDGSTPSSMNLNQIRLKEQDAIVTLDAAQVDAQRVSALSDAYQEKGRGAMSLTAPYPEDGDDNALSVARARGEAWKRAFEQHGAGPVTLTMVPLAPGEAGAGSIVMRYKTLAALPPKDCGRLPGYQGAENMETVDEYTIGCETQTALSKMISDPSDLEGKGGSQQSESRRAGTVVEKHKAGTPNEQLKGYSASTMGQSQ